MAAHGPQTSPSFQAWVESLAGRASGSGVTIFGDPDSRSSRSLWMARELEEAGALEINHVTIGRDNPFSVETDRINPNRRMPFCDDNGIHLFESMAINLHLAKRYELQPAASTSLRNDNLLRPLEDVPLQRG